MIKVAFILEGYDWLGGINYFRNLFSALALLPESKIHPILFVGTRVPAEVIENFTDIEVRKTSVLDAQTPVGFVRRIARKAFSQRDLVLNGLLVWHGIDVVSHFSGALPDSTRLKSMGWIPDFQYLHLPALFPPGDRKLREAAVERLLTGCDLILLSSESARDDLGSLSPQSLSKARVLHFVPKVDLSVASMASLADLEEKYGFSAPYFHLPNQFWVHKNHSVVIDALSVLEQRGKAVTVIATGSTRDHRFPEHYAQLIAKAERLDIQPSFKAIGIVPYQDLLSLMHHSVAVINPSLFEGWSTTVEEAKALDKTILLSDLPVHREQNPCKAIFFAPLNADELAAKMLDVCAAENAGQSTENLVRYSDTYQSDRMRFALSYQDIIVDLCSGKQAS